MGQENNRSERWSEMSVIFSFFICEENNLSPFYLLLTVSDLSSLFLNTLYMLSYKE